MMMYVYCIRYTIYARSALYWHREIQQWYVNSFNNHIWHMSCFHIFFTRIFDFHLFSSTMYEDGRTKYKVSNWPPSSFTSITIYMYYKRTEYQCLLYIVLYLSVYKIRLFIYTIWTEVAICLSLLTLRSNTVHVFICIHPYLLPSQLLTIFLLFS